MEEKLRFRDAEIYRLREVEHQSKNTSSVSSSRKQSRASSHLDLADLKDMIDEKEHEISVSSDF